MDAERPAVADEVLDDGLEFLGGGLVELRARRHEVLEVAGRPHEELTAPFEHVTHLDAGYRGDAGLVGLGPLHEVLELVPRSLRKQEERESQRQVPRLGQLTRCLVVLREAVSPAAGIEGTRQAEAG